MIELETRVRTVPVLQAGGLLFTGPDEALLGRSVRRWVSPRSNSSAWADDVLSVLAPDQVAMGALSFEPGRPAVMHLLDADVQRVPVGALATSPAQETAPVRHTCTEEPDPQEYAAWVRRALSHIERGDVEKVVLGRHLDVTSEPPLSAAEIVGRLLTSRPGPYVFCVPVPGGRDQASTVLGASPELLVRRTGDRVEAMPLAGSVPRSSDPREDLARRERLATSDKDLHEHGFVVRDILARLRAAGVEAEAPDQPVVVGTDTLWHLASPIAGQVVAPGAAGTTGGPSALHLAQILAPTPAVGGTPRAAALDLIAEIERVPRGYLAGSVGWVDGRGDGEFALTLRSAVLTGDRLRLFAGAGIVAGSDPETEVRETGAKLATMAKVVGL